jgi:hypothetical protein
VEEGHGSEFTAVTLRGQMTLGSGSQPQYDQVRDAVERSSLGRRVLVGVAAVRVRRAGMRKVSFMVKLGRKEEQTRRFELVLQYPGNAILC